VLESLHRVLGSSDGDCRIGVQLVEERYVQGIREVQEGKMVGYARAMYVDTFRPGERGDYEPGGGLGTLGGSD
jgi:hypothetical protein